MEKMFFPQQFHFLSLGSEFIIWQNGVSPDTLELIATKTKEIHTSTHITLPSVYTERRQGGSGALSSLVSTSWLTTHGPLTSFIRQGRLYRGFTSPGSPPSSPTDLWVMWVICLPANREPSSDQLCWTVRSSSCTAEDRKALQSLLKGGRVVKSSSQLPLPYPNIENATILYQQPIIIHTTANTLLLHCIF